MLKAVRVIMLLSISICAHATGKESFCKDMDSLVNNARQGFEKYYVLPGQGVKAVVYLNQMLREGTYKDYCDNPKKFASFITSGLRKATGDNHIQVEYLDHNEKSSNNNWIEDWKAKGPSVNFGIDEVKIMEGNIALLKISSFYTYNLIKSQLEAAMNFIQYSKALIIDVRNNGGGDSDTQRAITNTFFDNEMFLPLVIRNREGETTKPKLLIKPQWPRYGQQRPVAVLINGKSFSAAEALAYGLQAQGRAMVIGQISRGGANIMMDEPIKLSKFLQIWMPEKQPISLKTQKNWENTGVVPNIKADDAEAVIVAHRYLKDILHNK